MSEDEATTIITTTTPIAAVAAVSSAATTTTEKKVINHFKKTDVQRENSLYPDPTFKCYIGNGNNAEL